MAHKVLIVLSVPEHWPELEEEEIERKLMMNDHVLPFLAREIKRWAGSDEIDFDGLQNLIDGMRKD